MKENKSGFKRLLEIWSVFLKIGFLGFGGGSALIPVIKNQLVDKKKWFTEAEYLKHTIIANITPGALSVKIGASVGYEKLGGVGSLVAAYATTLPGVILTVGILVAFALIGEEAIGSIKYASVGISIFIISLMIVYILNVLKYKKKFCKVNIIICAFILTAGKEINNIASGILGYKLNSIDFIFFDISTISLMIIAFFIILFYGLLRSKISFVIAIVTSMIYIFIKEEKIIMANTNHISNIIVWFMVVLVIYVIKKNNSSKLKSDKKRITVNKQFVRAMALFIIIPIIVMSVAIILVPKQVDNVQMITKFTSDVTTSTATAFGGGASYISVAEGFFVENGFIKSDDFYSKVVAVANAMPGPLVVKIASGVGFVFGGSIQGVLFGIVLAILAITSVISIC